MPLISSWIESANDPEGNFPLNNLPYGVFSAEGSTPCCCVAVGDFVLDLAKFEASGLLPPISDEPVFDLPFLNEFMETGPDVWDAVRTRLIDLLRDSGDDGLSSNETLRSAVMFSRTSVELHLPFVVNEYTDFYAGKHHATNIGTMFRGAENQSIPDAWPGGNRTKRSTFHPCGWHPILLLG